MVLGVFQSVRTEVDLEAARRLGVTLGGLLQNQKDTPDPYGLPLSSTGSDLRLPRDTFLGMRWNEGRYRKQNAFVEVDHYLDDNWNLNVKMDYRRTFSVQEYASLAGSGGLGGGVSADGLLPLDGIQRYDHAGNQLTFQANVNGAFQALGRQQDRGEPGQAGGQGDLR